MTTWDYEAEFARAYRPEPVTWDEYMAEGYLRRRFDILDGIRHFYTSPMWEGEIKNNLTFAFIDASGRRAAGRRCISALMC